VLGSSLPDPPPRSTGEVQTRNLTGQYKQETFLEETEHRRSYSNIEEIVLLPLCHWRPRVTVAYVLILCLLFSSSSPDPVLLLPALHYYFLLELLLLPLVIVIAVIIY